MTNEEKAKAYDEALDRCKEWASGTCEQNVNNSPKDIAEFIFPALTENEDERIREFLIGILSQGTWRKEWPFSPNEVVAYLERQNHVQSDTEKEYVRTIKSLIFNFLRGKDEVDRDYYQRIENWLDGRHVEQKEKKPIEFKNDELVEIIKGEFEGFRRLLKKKGIDYEPQRSYWEAFARLFDSSARKYVKEQKPAEWSDEDVYIATILEHIVGKNRPNEIFKIRNKQGVSAYKICSWLKHLPERCNLQPKQEWSKEDEQRIAEIEFAVMQMNTKRVDTKDKCLAWLKSLRPQQKVEWSDEDTDMLNCCISSIEEAKENRYAYKETDGDTSYDREIDWLKSIRPQPRAKTNDYITPHKKFFKWIYNRLIDVHGENPNVDYMQSFKKRIDNLQFDESRWKPSDEQLRPLEYAIDYFKKKQNDTTYLESLYNDLKKLM